MSTVWILLGTPAGAKAHRGEKRSNTVLRTTKYGINFQKSTDSSPTKSCLADSCLGGAVPLHTTEDKSNSHSHLNISDNRLCIDLCSRHGGQHSGGHMHQQHVELTSTSLEIQKPFPTAIQHELQPKTTMGMRWPRAGALSAATVTCTAESSDQLL